MVESENEIGFRIHETSRGRVRGHRRGRISQEGANCTLTAKILTPRESFATDCENLTKYLKRRILRLPIWWNIRNGLSSWPAACQDELVTRLEKEKAPSLKQNKSKHVNAIEYHEMLKDKDSVVIDVRNHYEVDIGRVEPPEGGATFLNPEMLKQSRISQVVKFARDEETVGRGSG